MHLTDKNIGDVIFMYETGRRVKIDSVGDNCFTYFSENGSRYSMHDCYINGFADRNEASIAAFEQNMMLGRSLYAAEQSALNKYFNPRSDREKAEASHVLNLSRKQLEHFNARLAASRSVVDREMAEQFLSDLYEQGTGSHGVFMGHRVDVLSSWTGEFKIDGKEYGITEAADFLCGSKAQEHLNDNRKPGLDDMIHKAESKRSTSEATSERANPSVLNSAAESQGPKAINVSLQAER